ncbi:hypothetical protein N7453_003938 [Penicillium expansum]|nr:hypothetical protein N7453_003938 [Penicillium expansum]
MAPETPSQANVPVSKASFTAVGYFIHATTVNEIQHPAAKFTFQQLIYSKHSFPLPILPRIPTHPLTKSTLHHMPNIRDAKHSLDV